MDGLHTIRAVVLDIGGVLEHVPDTGWKWRWAQRLGLDAEDLDRRLAAVWRRGSVGAIDLATAEGEIAAALGLSDDGLRAVMDDLWAWYVGTLNNEIAAWLAALRPAYRTGILSNSFVGAREREQALYGFEAICDVLVYSHEEGCIKPDPRIYAIVCDRLGVAPEEAVLLDDVQANVEGARAAGMAGVQFRDTAQAIGEVERLLARGR
jgi:putative hydrolase of the HAD superfamily